MFFKKMAVLMAFSYQFPLKARSTLVFEVVVVYWVFLCARRNWGLTELMSIGIALIKTQLFIQRINKKR